MAFTTKTMLAITTLLMLATSQANALVYLGVTVTALNVKVGLHCQANPAGVVSGNAAPLTDITTILLLNNNPIASAITDLDGISRITINMGSLLSGIVLSNLKIRIGLPITSCSLYANTNGVLEGLVEVDNLVGSVLNVVVRTVRLVA